MKAIQISKYGGPDVLKLETLAEPQPGPEQVQIALKAAGVNFIDIYRRRGEYPVDTPYIPGLEGAGIIEALGPGVSDFKPGQRVAFTSQPGAYAEKITVDVNRLIPLPDELSFEEGAAFPLQGMTAHYLLHEFRSVRAGTTVLVHAAAGGMGQLLVQWAKHLGARVIGTTSDEKKAQSARLAGCEEVILYTQTDFAQEAKILTAGKGIDLIIDGVGQATFNSNLAAAASRGTIIIYGAASGPADPIYPNELQRKSLTICGGSLFNYLLTREELLMRANAVMEGIKSGWLKLNIEHILPLDKAKEAHTLLESRQSTGKIVLVI